MKYQLTIDYGYIKQFAIEAEDDAQAIEKAEQIIAKPIYRTAVEDANHIRLDRVNGHAPETNESTTTIKEFYRREGDPMEKTTTVKNWQGEGWYVFNKPGSTEEQDAIWVEGDFEFDAAVEDGCEAAYYGDGGAPDDPDVDAAPEYRQLEPVPAPYGFLTREGYDALVAEGADLDMVLKWHEAGIASGVAGYPSTYRSVMDQVESSLGDSLSGIADALTAEQLGAVIRLAHDAHVAGVSEGRRE